MQVCPLVFEPIFKPKIWGGQSLARLLGKSLPAGERIGESWECADLENGQSIVARGPMKGRSLHDLASEWGPSLLGRISLVDGRFPLLIKFLDAADNLSVQVHPDAEAAARLGIRPAVKDEAWHVIHAREGAVIYRGLRHGVRIDDYAAVLRSDPRASLDCLNHIAVRPGETYYIPSGTVHALGAGIVVAEIQTSSDTTYRLYDWDRVRPPGDAGMHMDEAIACLGRAPDPSRFEKRSHVTSIFTTVTRLVDCPSFRVERVRFMGEIEQQIPYAELVLWVLLEGRGEIRYGKSGVETFSAGDVVLLPAGLKEPVLRTITDCVWLEVTVPAASDLAEFDRPAAAALRDSDPPPGAPIALNIAIKRSPPG